MKPGKEDSKKGRAEKSAIRQAISVATVVASLGASLGVDVAAVLAEGPKPPAPAEAAQFKHVASWDWESLNANQKNLATQIKMAQEDQLRLGNRLKSGAQGKVSSDQLKALQSSEGNLSNHIKVLKADELKLSNQFKFWKSNLQKGSQDQIKLDTLVTTEQKISGQLKDIEATQSKLVDQLKKLQMKQGK